MIRFIRHSRVIKMTSTASKFSSSSSSVDKNNMDYIKITEGSATMNYNKNEVVFYNKVQVFNRDLSIQVIKLYSETIQQERNEKYIKKHNSYEENKQKQLNHKSEELRPPFPPAQGITILDALAATGLRSIRYLKEIPNVKHLMINDLDRNAVESALENCKLNNITSSDISDRVSIHHGDAAMFMYENRDYTKQYDVIDLDPYGTAAPFLDSAVQAVKDGGLLCITCTDMPCLAGNYPEVCFAKYGVMPLKSKYCHEMALRILLHAIDTAANKHKRYIVPWLSVSVDFYIRVFVRVYESPAEVKKSSLKRMMVYQSNLCPSFYINKLGVMKRRGDSVCSAIVTAPTVCPETQGNIRVGGPFWSDPIHSQVIVDELLKRLDSAPVADTEADIVLRGSVTYPALEPTQPSTIVRIRGVLTSIQEELKDVPLYYLLPELAQTIRVIAPPHIKIHSALMNAGYRVSQFHHEPNAIKTDAPPQVIWDIMRAFYHLQKGTKPPAAPALVDEMSHTASHVAEEFDEGDDDDDKHDESNENSTSKGKHKRKDENYARVRQRADELILSRPILTRVDFSIHPAALKLKNHTANAIDSNTEEAIEKSMNSSNKRKAAKVVRYAPNPEANWGPKRRAGPSNSNSNNKASDVAADSVTSPGVDTNDSKSDNTTSGNTKGQR